MVDLIINQWMEWLIKKKKLQRKMIKKTQTNNNHIKY